MLRHWSRRAGVRRSRRRNLRHQIQRSRRWSVVSLKTVHATGIQIQATQAISLNNLGLQAHVLHDCLEAGNPQLREVSPRHDEHLVLGHLLSTEHVATK